MLIDPVIRRLGWKHEMWGFVRLYRSLRNESPMQWLATLKADGYVEFEVGQAISVSSELLEHLGRYFECFERMVATAESMLRSQDEAMAACKKIAVGVEQTRTRSKDHHQSPKALVAEVSMLAAKHCRQRGLSVEVNPQRRAVWTKQDTFHVSARNLDGVIPRLLNPYLVWEIKEYWGKTDGGSKMSDAVYECHLVGLELRQFEEAGGKHVHHVVFLDGKVQWRTRRADLIRFIDLASQGLIDRLIIGHEVATEWPSFLAEFVPPRETP